MNTNIPIDEQLLRTTIRIVSIKNDGVTYSGTGFFFKFEINNHFVPCIVTNKHVVNGAVELQLTFRIDGDFGDNHRNVTVNIKNVDQIILSHPDKDVDLCLIKLAGILDYNNNLKLLIWYITKNNIIPDEVVREEISNIEDVTIIGYPDGIIDEMNNLPIVRRGITATSIKYDFKGRKEFLIDSAIFGGSSGSPVFIYDNGSYLKGNGIVLGSRLYLVGIVYAVAQHLVNGDIGFVQVPSLTKPIVQTNIPNNLGCVIKASRLFDFEAVIQKEIEKETNK